MTCSSSCLSLAHKDKYVTWISDTFRSMAEFCRYVERQKRGKILTVNYAYETSQKKPFVIVGKIVRLTPRFTDIRKTICKKSDAATTLLVKELVTENGLHRFSKVFKVKFVGNIAKNIESSDIHIGDRIVLINPVIAENTDFLQHPDINSLSALLFDDSSASVLLCAKLATGLSMPKNKFLSRLGCSTPISDGKSEPEVSEAECIENKNQMSSSDRILFNKAARRNILKEHTKQNSPKKTMVQKTEHPALTSNDQQPIEYMSGKTKNMDQSRSKGVLRKSTPVKKCGSDAINDDVDAIEPCEKNINDDLMTSFVEFNRKNEDVGHNFIKIRDINEKHLNKKIDMFVIVVDVRQSEIEGKKKKCLVTRVIDDTCNKFKPFTIYIYYEDKKPKVEQKWILRIRHVKIESYKGVYDGRIFTAGSIIAFSPSCSDLELEKPVTLRKSPYECNDFDMNYVTSLRRFLIGKHWNLLVMMGGFYPTPPPAINQSTLESITNETWFSLKCEIVHVRIFFDYNIIVLTVKDETVMPHYCYCVPKECKLWSEALVSREKYFVDLKEVDIILKNVDLTFDSTNLKEYTQVLINNIQILRNKTRNQGLEALIFVVDASHPESKVDVIPSLMDLQASSENQENTPVLTVNGEEAVGAGISSDNVFKTKSHVVKSGLNNNSSNLKENSSNICASEEVESCLKKQTIRRKKLFYQDSSNFDVFITSSESTCDFYDSSSKSKKFKSCSVVLDKIPHIESTAGPTKPDTVADDNNCADKNDTTVRTEKDIEIDRPPRKRKIFSDNEEMDAEKNESTLNKTLLNGSECTKKYVSEPSTSSFNKGEEKDKLNEDQDQNMDHQIVMSNTCSSSFMTIKKNEGIKVSPNIMNLNLLPVVAIEKIDDKLFKKQMNEPVCAKYTHLDSSFTLNLNEEDDKGVSNSNEHKVISQNEKFTDKTRERPITKQKNSVLLKNPFSSRNCEVSENLSFNKINKVKRIEKIDLGSDEEIFKSSFHVAGNQQTNNYHDNKVQLRYRNLPSHKVSMHGNLVSYSSNSWDNDCFICNNNNRLIRGKKRNSFKTNIISKSDTTVSSKVNSSKIDRLELQTEKTSEPGEKSSCSVLQTGSLLEKPLTIDGSNAPVIRNRGRPKKQKKKRGIEEIVNSLSKSRQKLILSSNNECHSPVHISDNKSNNQSPMELIIDEESCSLKSDCSDHLSHKSQRFNCCNIKGETEDNDDADCNQYDVKQYSTLNNINTKTTPQFMRVFSVSRKDPTNLTAKVKVSLKNKILSRTVPKMHVNNNCSDVKNDVSSQSSSDGSVAADDLLLKSKRKLTSREPLMNPDSVDSNIINKRIKKNMSGIENSLQKVEADPPLISGDVNLEEIRVEVDKEKEQEELGEQGKEGNNKETESQSQSISEFVKADGDENPIPGAPMSALVINQQMTFKALIWDLQPKLADNPFNIVSGLCEYSCENFFLYSTLKYNSDKKPVCPVCCEEGKDAVVKLQFLFELFLILQTGHSINALVFGDHAVKFLGCTVQEYLHDTNICFQITQKLQHFLGIGRNSSIRYTPPIPVHIIPIGLTGADQTSVIKFCIINTELPPINYQSVHSMFISTV